MDKQSTWSSFCWSYTSPLLQNINPVLKKQRELELTQMTNENIRIKRQIEEEE